MKMMKKVMALILSLLVVMCMAVPVVGADPTYSITIENAVENQTYKAYKIFDAVPAATGTNISYTIESDSQWFDVVTDFLYLKDDGTIDTVAKPAETDGVKAKEYNGKGLTLTQIDGGTTYTVVADNAFDVDMAKSFAEYLSKNIGSKTASGTATATIADGATDASATIDVSSSGAGYYFVDTTLGALSSLGTVKGNTTATIKEKNSEPSVVKEVNRDNNINNDTDDNNAWVSDNDANIGDTVYFQSTITVEKACAENVVLVDKMSAGLTLNADSIAVYYNDTKVNASAGGTTNYTLTTSGLEDGKTFTIAFDNDYIAGILSELADSVNSTTIMVTYNATLNKNAKVGADEGNPNETHLEYGNETNKTSSTSSKTITYTWGFDVLKYTGTEKTPLSDAVFVLSTSSDAPTVTKDANGKIIKVEGTGIITFGGGTAVNNSETPDEKIAMKYQVEKDGTVNSITTDSTGKIMFEGLESGTYYLHEIKAPDGYNMITAPLTVEIEAAHIDDNAIDDGTDNNKVSMTLNDGSTGTYNNNLVEVENKAGSALPETGGIGTTIFYVVGGIMMVVAIVLLVTKKKMSKK